MNPNMRIAVMKATKTNDIKVWRINMESIWENDAPQVRFNTLKESKSAMF